MRIKFITHLAIAALLVAVCASAASAQVVTINGKVTLKQADGTVVPVKDALVEIHRTDIKQDFTAKTDKGGKYVNVGIPLTGTYTLIVSAPGARPTYIANIKLSAQPENNFELEAGDGSKLTMEQIKAATAGGGGGGAQAASSANSAEAKKRAAELEAERKRIETENAKAAEINAKLPEILKSGDAAFKAKKYDEAISFFDQGLQVDPEQAVFYEYKAVALRARGVDKYNAAVQNKDQTARASAKDAARADFKAATEAAEKAVSTYREFTSKRQAGNKGAGGGGAGPNPQSPNEELGYMEQRSETYRIALQTSTQIDNEAAVKAIQEYIAAESDPAKKMKAQSGLGDALFLGGHVDEAIATYRQILQSNPQNLDAIFGLGIALAAGDPSHYTEARDMLQQFVNKAPETNSRRQEAMDSVKYLDDTLKAANNKQQTNTDTNTNKGRTTRRKP